MDRESVERLRFDRRLKGRRDWVDQDAAQANLDALPDVSDNMTTAAELEAEEEAARAKAEAEAASAPPAPEAASEPAAPTFGGPTSVGGGGFGGDGNSLGG